MKVPRWVGWPAIVLVLGVAAWWLLIIGTVRRLVPSPVREVGTALVPGRTVYIYSPPVSEWQIPVTRAAYDDYNRTFEADGEGGLVEVLSRADWVVVSNRQAVLLIEVDGIAAQVEAVDGPEAGRRGWLLTRHITPYP